MMPMAGVAMSDFLLEHRLQYVAPEIASAAEEFFFALCESNSSLLFLTDERNEANEIGNLKELVSVWPHVLCEIPSVAETCRHGFVYEIRDGGLSAVVIHLYSAVRGNCGFCGIKESEDAQPELLDNLFFGGHELLVYANAAIAKWGFSGECHHRGKYPVAQFPSHVFVAVFPPDERSGMKAKIGKPHSGQGIVEFADLFGYLFLLVVGDKRHYVESGRVAGKWEIAGFVNEYAQCSVSVHVLKARAAVCPPLKAKNFLRISVTPAFWLLSPRIVSNRVVGNKGANLKM